MIILKEDTGHLLDAFDTVKEFKAYMRKFVEDFNKEAIEDGEEPTNYDNINEFQIARDFSLIVEFI